jgi:plasmid stabilization system protein ParE
MKVFLTFRARTELRNIQDYIAKGNVTAASAVIARIEKVAKALADQPYMGRKLSRGCRRRLTVTPYPYLIYYEVVGDTVRILSIRHAARYRAAFQESARAFGR